MKNHMHIPDQTLLTYRHSSTIEITTVSLTTVTTIDLQATVTTNATSDVFTTTTETASPTVTQQATTNDECNSVHVSGVTYSNTFTGRGGKIFSVHSQTYLILPTQYLLVRFSKCVG